jgi:hypothetical protein
MDATRERDADTDAGARRAGLEAHGYRVALRHAGWTECLVSRGEERWLGRGLTAAEAVEDALAQMLPSALARELWLASLPPSEEVAAEAEPRGETAEVPPPSSDGHEERDAEASPAAAAPERGGEEPTAAAVDDDGDAMASDPPDKPDVARVVAASVPHLPPSRPIPRPTPPDPKRPSSLAHLASLQRELGRDLPRLARLAPDTLRLEMLAAICRARAFTDEHPGDPIIERAVGDVARDLTELGKRWWPGSVRALQLRATPADVAKELTLRGAPPARWADAVALVEAALADERARAGANAAGWSDDRECAPPPPDPVALLTEVAGAIDPKHASEATLQEQARKLRWLRPHLPEEAGETWADAIGALRRHADRAGVASLRALLDPSYRPHGNWAREAGQDPKARQMRKRRAKLLRGMPKAGVAPAVVAAWLSEAFALGDELPNPKIAAHIGHLKDVVLGLSDDDLTVDERRLRRRLGSLQDMLANDRLVEVPLDDSDLDDDDDDDDDDDVSLTAQVRDKVSGQRALLLSNRADPDLERKLEESLGIAVTMSLVDTRRRQAAAQAVESGSYELILAAHRFIGHDVDKDIGQRARAGGIPYVRVGSGRVASVVRALAREWGL